MFIPFEQLPETARIWIYQSGRPFTPTEKAETTEILMSFAGEWVAHGQPLRASFRILYDRFIVLSVDEAFHAPSGCSIDDSVHAIKEIGAKTGIDFFDRSMVLFLSDNRVTEIPVKELKEKYAQGIWSAESLTFNTLAGTKKELAKWLVEARNTWLKRYIISTVATSGAQ